MATGPTIDYEALQQEALRGIVRSVLKRVAEHGLTGDHHFYISFLTRAPGVMLSKRLKEKYPDEMTIVLQHRFWDMIVTDDRFEVKLTFDGIPERLVVPYAAVKVFIDPSVGYGIQFEDLGAEREAAAADHAMPLDAAYDSVGGSHTDLPRTGLPKKPRTARKPRTNKPQAAPAAAGISTAPKTAEASTTAATDDTADADADTAAAEESASGGAKILSFERFKKK